MATEDTKPEDNGISDPSGQLPTNDQGQNPPVFEKQESPDTGATPNNQPASKGAPPEGEKAPEVPKTVPMDRFTTVYRRMKDAERKAQEYEAKTSTPAANTSTPAAPASDGAPDWADYEAAGKSEADFTNDWVDHKIRQGVSDGIARSKETEREKTSQNALADRQTKAEVNLQTKAAAARAAHPDFDATIDAARNLGIGFAPSLELAISEHENAGELGYQLAKNHDVAYKLMTLPPEQALLALGTFIAKMPTGNSQPANKLTELNPPITPLNGGGAPVTQYADDMSDADFDRMFPPD